MHFVRYFPSQIFGSVLKDYTKLLFPVYNAKTQYWKWFIVNVAWGTVTGIQNSLMIFTITTGALSLALVYPVDVAITKVICDVPVHN